MMNRVLKRVSKDQFDALANQTFNPIYSGGKVHSFSDFLHKWDDHFYPNTHSLQNGLTMIYRHKYPVHIKTVGYGHKPNKL